jgi:hypothetical protein
MGPFKNLRLNKLIVFVSITLVFFTLTPFLQPLQRLLRIEIVEKRRAPPSQELRPIGQKTQENEAVKSIEVDFNQLIKTGSLPRYLNSLRKIDWIYHDLSLKSLIPIESLPFRTSPQGNYKVEIDVFSADSSKSRTVILQMNFTEIVTGNKIFEISRNYEFKQQKDNQN